MKKFKQFFSFGGLLLTASLFFAACNNGKNEEETKISTETTEAKPDMATAAMCNLSATTKDTALTGTVEFVAQDGKVKMMLTISAPIMANKSVAVHIHEMGDCGDMGKMAHGHWNPTGKEHGKWGSASFHSGDIGNVTLDATGKGIMELTTDLWSIGGDEKTNILNRSIIVHGGVDDFTTQPTGNAGSRIGCGVIMKK